jgi:uncharacterized protein
MEVTRYLASYTTPERPGKVMLFVLRRGAVLELPEELWDALPGDDLPDSDRQTLTGLGVLVASRVGEREELRTIFERMNARSRRFTALVTLTLECNLACPYCYEDPFRGDFVMSASTAELLIRKTVARMDAGLDVIFDFYGGEALLALPLLKKIAGRLLDEARRRGRTFSFNLVTNGTLLKRKTVLELVELGLKGVKITLDGPQDIHDTQRPFVSGNGSFDAIVANIQASWELIRIQLGSNYTRDNYQRYPELLDQLLAAGITPDKLQMVIFNPVIPKSDGSTFGDFSASCSCSSEPWLIAASLYLRAETLKRGFNTPKPLPSACMVEFSNDLVVGYDGGLYKCPAFMGLEEMKVGTLADGIGEYRLSHNLDVWKSDECLDCPYLPLCFGGCRYLGRLRNGAIDAVDCRKDFLDAVLEKFVRQDLELRSQTTPNH